MIGFSVWGRLRKDVIGTYHLFRQEIHHLLRNQVMMKEVAQEQRGFVRDRRGKRMHASMERSLGGGKERRDSKVNVFVL
jgi:hypothetical protein